MQRVNIMAADYPAPCITNGSTAMVLVDFSKNIPISEPEGLSYIDCLNPNVYTMHFCVYMATRLIGTTYRWKLNLKRFHQENAFQ